MSYTLYIGDRAYSSWSLRGWLLFENFGLKAETILLDFSGESVRDQLKQLIPARTVPTLVTPEGAIVSESLAIAEELASRHPDAGHWPRDAKARAIARTLTAEMATGFSTLRSNCPMNLRKAHTGMAIDDDLRADLDRIEAIWSAARDTLGDEGTWLCGAYSVADVFFAPVAARIAGYDLPVGRGAEAYVAAHLADPAFRRWRAMGLVRGNDLPWYAMDLPERDWPGPAPREASPTPSGPAENDTCPYSGKPVAHFMKTEGRVIGFCNEFCREKTAADVDVWPDVVALLDDD